MPNSLVREKFYLELEDPMLYVVPLCVRIGSNARLFVGRLSAEHEMSFAAMFRNMVCFYAHQVEDVFLFRDPLIRTGPYSETRVVLDCGQKNGRINVKVNQYMHSYLADYAQRRSRSVGAACRAIISWYALVEHNTFIVDDFDSVGRISQESHSDQNHHRHHYRVAAQAVAPRKH